MDEQSSATNPPRIASSENERLPEPMRIVTVRAMCIACALMPLLAFWVVLSELIWYSGHSTAISLFYHVTFVVFLLALFNLYLQKRWPKSALSAGELMTIYMMLSIAGTFCSHDLIQVMLPLLAYPAYAANPQNRWGELILSHVPSWAIVMDKDAVSGFAVGNASLYNWHILLAWLKPLSFWFVFMMALMGALLGINIFFRQPWTEKERLSFPVIQIPMMIATQLGSLLRNKLFWIAFGIAAGIDAVNGFHHFFPNIPAIPIVDAFKFSDYFVERPWSAIRDMTINLYPFVIGIAFFLPADLAFSCWFFFIMFNLQNVLASAIGIRDIPGFPFETEQAAGGYLALGLLAVWLARKHLRGAGRTIFGKPGGADDSGEPIRYRTAFIMLIASCAVLLLCGMSLGGSWWGMIAFFVIFLLYSLAIARIRAELGPPAHDLHGIGPEVVIHNALGTKALGDGNLTSFSLFYWFNRAYRAHFSAHSMEGFKIAQLCRITSRSMMKAMIVAIIVGSLSAFWAVLHALYVHGYSSRFAGQLFAQETWMRMSDWMSFPEKANVPATIATGAGVLFSLLLGAMRMRFTWWMFHPVGYAISSSWSMSKLWFCIYLAWLAKVIITRYGGAVAYRKAIPFFVGLVLGEFTMGSLWGIYGSLFNTPVYHFWG